MAPAKRRPPTKAPTRVPTARPEHEGPSRGPAQAPEAPQVGGHEEQHDGQRHGVVRGEDVDGVDRLLIHDRYGGRYHPEVDQNGGPGDDHDRRAEKEKTRNLQSRKNAEVIRTGTTAPTANGSVNSAPPVTSPLSSTNP